MATRQVSTGVREILKEHVRRPPKPGWMYVPWHKITREHEQSSIFTPRDSIGSETRFTFPGKKTRHSRSNDSSRYEGRSGREKGAASRNFCARHATPTPTPLIGCLLLPRARSSLRVAPPLAPHFAPRESKSKWKFIPLLSLSLSLVSRDRKLADVSSIFPHRRFLRTLRSDVTQASVFIFDAFAEKIGIFNVLREISSLSRECPSRDEIGVIKDTHSRIPRDVREDSRLHERRASFLKFVKVQVRHVMHVWQLQATV